MKESFFFASFFAFFAPSRSHLKIVDETDDAINTHSVPARPSGPPLKWVLLSIAIIALAVVSRVGMLCWPFLNDSGLYAQLGRTVAEGHVLYRDFYETKLPGAALLASVFWRAFGSHWAGYVLCQLALAMLAAMALARAARRHLGPTAALPTFLFAIVFLNLSQAVYTGFQLETLQAFFEALAALAAFEALSHDDAFASFTAGLAASTAAMAKPGGISVAVALLIVTLLFGRRRILRVACASIGIAIPVSVTVIYTLRTGAAEYLPAVMRDIANYASGTPINLDVLLKLGMVLLVMGFPFLFRLRDFKMTIGGTRMLRGFVWLWFGIEFISVLAQRRLYPYHFLPMACPAALLYGMLPQRKIWPIALGLLPIALLSLTWEGSSVSRMGVSRHLAASDYIASHTSPGDAVFADQAGRLLIESNRQPGSRLGTFFYLVNDDDAPRRYMQILLSDFELRKPVYLVLPANWDVPVPGLANCDILQHCPQRRENFIRAWGTLRDYVALRYHLETTMEGCCLYRRNP